MPGPPWLFSFVTCHSSFLLAHIGTWLRAFHSVGSFPSSVHFMTLYTRVEQFVHSCIAAKWPTAAFLCNKCYLCSIYPFILSYTYIYSTAVQLVCVFMPQLGVVIACGAVVICGGVSGEIVDTIQRVSMERAMAAFHSLLPYYYAAYMYIYIYIYVCICRCTYAKSDWDLWVR